jgi:prepilin-type N-terminal cleavage/methylation domain-containing protein
MKELYRSCTQAGYSAVELIVAVVVLAIGVLGLSATASVVSGVMKTSSLDSRLKFTAQAAVERLLLGPSDRLASGERRMGNQFVSWQVSGDSPRHLVVVARDVLGEIEAADTLATIVRAP